MLPGKHYTKQNVCWFEKQCISQTLQRFLFLKSLKSFWGTDNTRDSVCSMAGTLLPPYPHTYLDKSLRHCQSCQMPFFRKEMLVSSAFLGTFKNTWRLHSICVLTAFTAGKTGYLRSNQSWALWTQACFIPWRYDGECVTPSKSRWILKHIHKKVWPEGPSVRRLEVDIAGRSRRREGIIQAARKVEKWSWVTSFWLKISYTFFPIRAAGSRAHPVSHAKSSWLDGEPCWLEGRRHFWLVLLCRTRSLLWRLLVAVTYSFHPTEGM